jgi:hypothetical protein
MKIFITVVLVLAFLVLGATIAFAQNADDASEVANSDCLGSGIGCTDGADCDNELGDGLCLGSDSAQPRGCSGGGCRR